jgi:uncharacterized protein YjiS (DUF1127 family)
MLRLLTPRSTEDLWPTELSVKPTRSAGRRLGWRRIASGVQTYLASKVQQRRLLRAERQLEDMDDRMLKDIGIGRSEIRRVVRHGRGV